ENLATALEIQAPSDEMDQAVCQCVGRLAATLKPEYAMTIQRIEVEGVSVKAFAAQEGISASNAGVRVHRAREALRRQVAASCGTCAEHGCMNCCCGH
ncbi:MAG TPA: sigma factor-like helix-turn-helix DNA-binding protein, partial [Polyangiaceae bacterium]|nr:sigma factor-like helix-turn-helix DNA-binding protein [Polyangiaceae bacterium]